MAKAVWKALWVVLLPCCCFTGCEAMNNLVSPVTENPDPFQVQILKQDAADKKPGAPTRLLPDLILREIPLRTPVAKARAFMEQHGFSCSGGVPEGSLTCLDCRAWIRKNSLTVDRIVVRFYYENNRVINEQITVERDLPRPEHSSWF